MIAGHYDTSLVPEYAREYCLRRDPAHKWRTGEFVHIAAEQTRREDLAAKRANKVLIADTNAFATEIWHERHVGGDSYAVGAIGERARADLYLLTGDEIPFVPDEIRDGEQIRHEMHNRFIDELENRRLPYAILRGAKDERLAEAVNYIDEIIQRTKIADFAPTT
jgi:nicotinamide riboside kinase